MSASISRHGEHIAGEVRRRRQQRLWTLDVAAVRLGVSRRLLAQIEAGQANPSLSTLLSIAEGFDVSLVELLAGADKPSITVQTDPAAVAGRARRSRATARGLGRAGALGLDVGSG
jgi:transcriptional regulator with XRE-family HTH domain